MDCSNFLSSGMSGRHSRFRVEGFVIASRTLFSPNGMCGHRNYRTPPLPKRRLLERAQLARVQRLAPRLQELDGGKPDLEVLRHGRLVERVGGAGQLDLAMQRLVRNAEQ